LSTYVDAFAMTRHAEAITGITNVSGREAQCGGYNWYQHVTLCEARGAVRSMKLVSGHFLIGEKKAPRKGPVVIASSGYDQRLIGGYLT
jgi:hypothetical protein